MPHSPEKLPNRSSPTVQQVTASECIRANARGCRCASRFRRVAMKDNAAPTPPFPQNQGSQYSSRSFRPAPVALSIQAEHESARKLPRQRPMERLFRSLKTEWEPTVEYISAPLAQQDIGRLLMQRYHWRRLHQFNGRLSPAVATEKLNAVSGTT